MLCISRCCLAIQDVKIMVTQGLKMIGHIYPLAIPEDKSTPWTFKMRTMSKTCFLKTSLLLWPCVLLVTFSTCNISLSLLCGTWPFRNEPSELGGQQMIQWLIANGFQGKLLAKREKYEAENLKWNHSCQEKWSQKAIREVGLCRSTSAQTINFKYSSRPNCNISASCSRRRQTGNPTEIRLS